MLQTHDTKHMLATKLTSLLLLGSVIWISLLVVGAKHLANDMSANTYDVRVGSLLLNTLTRHEQSHGSIVTLTFGNGLIWYFGLFVGTAICWQLMYILAVRRKAM